jgi:exopolysaccharide biosynthesis polyprenyl glycosylphosphotransferase
MGIRRQVIFAFWKATDLALMVLAFGLSVWIAILQPQGMSFGRLLSVRLKLSNILLFLGFLLLWHLVLSWLGLYRSHRLQTFGQEALDVLKATSIGTVAIFNAGILFDIQILSVKFTASFWLLSTGLTLLSRLLLRGVLESARRKGRNLRKVLIVGTNSRAMDFADRLRSHPEAGMTVIGFADKPWFGLEVLAARGEKLVCSLEELDTFLGNSVVDEVVLALPAPSCYFDSERVVRACEKQGITVRLLSDFFNLKVASARVETFDEQPFITLTTGRMEGGSVAIKRILDIAIAAALIVLLAPLFFAISLLIKLGSKGPVLFVQDRIGLGKRRFPLYKFRTMVLDAETQQVELEHLNEVEGPVFKIENDPRTTNLGRFLRRTSLDELPQLMNVFLGDMSLVGPRPLPVRDYEGFSEDWHRRRFSVRPGLTCLWQIQGRSTVSFDRWMELDMQYIDEWSFWLDLRILAKTVPVVIKGTGAS